MRHETLGHLFILLGVLGASWEAVDLVDLQKYQGYYYMSQ